MNPDVAIPAAAGAVTEVDGEHVPVLAVGWHTHATHPGMQRGGFLLLVVDAEGCLRWVDHPDHPLSVSPAREPEA